MKITKKKKNWIKIKLINFIPLITMHSQAQSRNKSLVAATKKFKADSVQLKQNKEYMTEKHCGHRATAEILPDGSMCRLNEYDWIVKEIQQVQAAALSIHKSVRFRAINILFILRTVVRFVWLRRKFRTWYTGAARKSSNISIVSLCLTKLAVESKNATYTDRLSIPVDL